jgi:anti-sigma regulatory factor (Ser/Thr protein kinase)
MNNRDKGIKIRRQILRDVGYHPSDLVNHISTLFSITPQAVHNHIKRLEKEERLTTTGRGKGKRYFLGSIRDNIITIPLDDDLSEDTIWASNFKYIIEEIPHNIQEICYYGFTEMVNNAIDHSEGKTLHVGVFKYKNKVSMYIVDDGEGIFKKIRRLCHLADERQAILELSKGKLTTDPERHTGEGIFFTSRAFDVFEIESKGLKFSHNDEFDFDFLFEADMLLDNSGTMVFMSIGLESDRILKSIFDDFAGPDEYQFNKTVIPVKLAQYGNEMLVSRSQAKRLLTRIENFENVIFDFQGVESVGQAFADEIFRVYVNQNPDIIISPMNMTNDVEDMVKRAQGRN